MQNLLEYHELYKNDYESFKSRFDFEIFYWYYFRKLKALLENEFATIRPFTNNDHRLNNDSGGIDRSQSDSFPKPSTKIDHC